MNCNLTCGYSRLPSQAGTPAEGPMLCDTEYTWNGETGYGLTERSRTPGERTN